MDLLGLIVIPNWLLVICMLIGTIYVYLTWNFGYWESQKVKTIPPVPLLGSMLDGFSETIAEGDLKNYVKYGKVYGLYEFRNPYLMVYDLDLIKQILIKDFNHFVDKRIIPLGGKSRITRQFLTSLRGDEWRSARAILTPTFSSGKLRQMAGLMEKSAHKMAKAVHDDIKTHNGEINVKDRFGVFTMDVIASCCFGTTVDSQDPNDPFIQHARLLFSRNFTLITFVMVLFPKLIELFEISMFSAKCLSYFEQVVHKLAKYRRSNNTRRNDFFQLLLDAQASESEGKLLDDPDSDPTTNSSSSQEDDPMAWKKIKVLDESGLVASAILFLLAGFETTANTVSFATYLMALNPECQQKLLEEIDLTLEKHGMLSHEVIMSMSYLDKVVSETLRMYPGCIRLERVCTSDYKMGDVFIRKGVMVAAGVYAIHYDPEIYPEPHRFDPERFSTENKAQRHPMAYMPFGAGPRLCIGVRFALMEAKICLAHFFKEFKVSPCTKTEIPLKMRPGVPILIPISPVILRVEARH